MKSKNTFKPGENLLGGYHELDKWLSFNLPDEDF